MPPTATYTLLLTLVFGTCLGSTLATRCTTGAGIFNTNYEYKQTAACADLSDGNGNNADYPDKWCHGTDGGTTGTCYSNLTEACAANADRAIGSANRNAFIQYTLPNYGADGPKCMCEIDTSTAGGTKVGETTGNFEGKCDERNAVGTSTTNSWVKKCCKKPPPPVKTCAANPPNCGADKVAISPAPTDPCSSSISCSISECCEDDPNSGGDDSNSDGGSGSTNNLRTDDDDDEPDTTWIWVLVVLGSLFAVFLLIALYCFCCKNSKK